MCVNTIYVECKGQNIEFIFTSDSLIQFKAFSEKKLTSSNVYSKKAFKFCFTLNMYVDHILCK